MKSTFLMNSILYSIISGPWYVKKIYSLSSFLSYENVIHCGLNQLLILLLTDEEEQSHLRISDETI